MFDTIIDRLGTSDKIHPCLDWIAPRRLACLAKKSRYIRITIRTTIVDKAAGTFTANAFQIRTLLFILSLFPHVARVALQGTEHDAPHEHVPEDVEKEKNKERCKSLVLHPVYEPNAFGGLPSACICRNKVELVPDRVERQCTKIDTEVCPNEHEGGKDAGCECVEIQIVEPLGHGQEGVGDVHTYEHGCSDHSEVDKVRPANEPQSDEVMCDELIVVFAGRLETQQHD